MADIEKLESQIETQRGKCKKETEKLKKLEKSLQEAKTRVYLDVIDGEGGITANNLREALQEYKKLHSPELKKEMEENN